MEKVKEANTRAEDTRKFQLVVIRLGDEEYGLHIDQIKEVVLTPNITRLPQTPNYVKGVANVRGNIIAIVDLEEKFGLQQLIENQQKKDNYTLVIESEEMKMGVLVKEVPNTLSVTMSQIEEAGNIVQDGQSDQSYIKGIVKLDDRLVIMIDIFKTLSENEISGIFKMNKQNAAV
ncbi:chemotaxis protein CheW [Marivirga lumbricoides]|uniref:Chemotaxis protein CheW n=1 Tax=Marivirga lumbricoides TaxID=1046115 RepID=A0ABQ1LT28_9BACT|nr:chemotaxis protein CheW [Marivirga lumbricoides]